MHYRNLDLKVDQFVAYLNEDKINLIPPFQRGHVWNLKVVPIVKTIFRRQ